MTISKLRMAAATGLVVLMVGAGAGSVLAADPTPTGVEAAESTTEATGIEAADSTTDPAGAEAAGIGHADAPGVDVNWEFNGQE